MRNIATLHIGDRLRSFYSATKGIAIMVVSQKNAWVHAMATIAVVIAGIYFDLTGTQWALVVLAIMAVWIAEAFNTAFELLSDAVSPEYHPLVGKAKDVAAGAVLIAAVGAAVVGVLVFGPRILDTWVR